MSHPFLTYSQLQALNLPLPSLKETGAALPKLDLSKPFDAPLQLQGYQHFYGLSKLNARHWQGYLEFEDEKIHLQVFAPHQAVKGTVWLLHGYLEHSAIYQPIIQEILEHGFSVITFDLPGHGLTTGEIAGIKDFAIYQQILQHLQSYSANFTDILPAPYLGIGQSTGGAIWIDHLLQAASVRQNPMINNALLLSPLVRPAKSAWWHNQVGLNLLKKVRQQLPRTFKRNNHNPEFLRFVRLTDPLQAKVISLVGVSTDPVDESY